MRRAGIQGSPDASCLDCEVANDTRRRWKITATDRDRARARETDSETKTEDRSRCEASPQIDNFNLADRHDRIRSSPKEFAVEGNKKINK